MLNVRRTTTAAGLLLAAVALTACNPPASTTTKSDTKAPAAAPVQATTPAAAAPAAPADDESKDVEIASCQVDNALHWPSADLKITNHSAKSSNYIVNIEFVDAGGTRLAEGLAATNNLAAGQAANVKAQGTSEVKGKVSCKVSKVTRYAAM